MRRASHGRPWITHWTGTKKTKGGWRLDLAPLLLFAFLIGFPMVVRVVVVAFAILSQQGDLRGYSKDDENQ